MPGPMSRPDGVRETPEQRKERGRKIVAGKPVKTGKTAKK
ncbi:hypothetical protein SEA_YABOI_176 [Streptomyces phage Yaboi]|jgi:hypothetical protein|uniref:Uncharacterized protein n=3 Tax=Streptomyces virus Yaboi TaxID=2846408 RepID=A0A385UGW0_9CAUD|nr:hypothetical protein HWB86_gp137 [Streptomyces phage Yaboi]QAY08806.1 hypothetical protein SEA_GENIE2_174 [Streptomyces phage Genie2]QAY12796.1 hypothetical protein SEA_BOOMERJR_174 [Streptomyces phage BoomerJR]UVD39990.1 hypothetical protein SEA_STANIMAL_173 [Streptomyces phage Stanimal]WNM73732.1 hypothetical protein SEA_SOLLERTIA_174 [Streptomyces phage Sollertia]AYB70982.1 hypothetical protein SEA_YABOI_176 [Streptomyces phage Yaboi]